MQQDKQIKVWVRIGADITMPLEQIQRYFDGDNEFEWKGEFSPQHLLESGYLSFEGDCYIPEESFEYLRFADDETANCPFCTSELYASPARGYKWYCKECDTHLKDFATHKVRDRG